MALFNPRLFPFAAFALVLLAASELVAATTYVVRDGIGWKRPPNPANYANWAARHTFRVRDVLVFNFTTGTDDVARVTRADYDGCSANNVIGQLITVGPASLTLDATGPYFYISTFPQHCSGGQKLAVNVTAAASPTPSTPGAPPGTPSPTMAPTAPPTRGTPPPATTPTPPTSPTPSPTPSPPSPSISQPPTPSPTLAPPSPSQAPAPTPSSGTGAPSPMPSSPSPSGGPSLSPSAAPGINPGPPAPPGAGLTPTTGPSPPPPPSPSSSMAMTTGGLVTVAMLLFYRLVI